MDFEREAMATLDLDLGQRDAPEQPASKQASAPFDVRHRFAADFVAVLTEAIESTCFQGCMEKRSAGKFDQRDAACVERCGQRFLDAWNVVGAVIAQVNEQLSSRYRSK